MFFCSFSGSLKRNQHLGPSDIYLDDLPSLDSENVALYFPKRCLGSGWQGVWDWGLWSQRLPLKDLGGKRTTFIFFCILIIAALFVFSDCGMGARRWSEPSNQKLLENPNPEHIAECTLDSVDKIELSLCGGLADSRDISVGMLLHGASHFKD